MARIVNAFCHTCKESFQGVANAGSYPTECGNCHTKRQDRERREYFGALDALTIEERIRKIEEWIYNYRPYKGPTTFG